MVEGGFSTGDRCWELDDLSVGLQKLVSAVGRQLSQSAGSPSTVAPRRRGRPKGSKNKKGTKKERAVARAARAASKLSKYQPGVVQRDPEEDLERVPGESAGIEDESDPTDPDSLDDPTSHQKRKVPYSEEIGLKVCHLVSGGMSLNSIAKKPKFPSLQELYRWLREHTEFADSFELAKQERGHSIVESMVTTIEKLKKNEIDPQTAKVILENYRWLASKFVPQNYGTKTEDPVTQVVVEMTPEEAQY